MKVKIKTEQSDRVGVPLPEQFTLSDYVEYWDGGRLVTHPLLWFFAMIDKDFRNTMCALVYVHKDSLPWSQGHFDMEINSFIEENWDEMHEACNYEETVNARQVDIGPDLISGAEGVIVLQGLGFSIEMEE